MRLYGFLRRLRLAIRILILTFDVLLLTEHLSPFARIKHLGRYSQALPVGSFSVKAESD